MDTLTLPYGLSEAVPPGACIAWGARFIINADGYVDLPPDRQGVAGDFGRDDLFREMQLACPMGDLMALIRRAILDGVIDTRIAERHLLVDNGVIRFEADTKASAGYLYVAAFYKE